MIELKAALDRLVRKASEKETFELNAKKSQTFRDLGKTFQTEETASVEIMR